MTDLIFDPEAMRERIRTELSRQSRSQADVVEKANLGHGYLTNILARKQMPSVDKLHALCNELGVTVSWIMYGSEANKETKDEARFLVELIERNPEKANAIRALLEK